MGLMRKLMMGCIPGVRTLVNTTEPHTSPELMNTPITLTVGASYSVSWTGDVPTTTSDYIYPFRVYGGTSVLYDMCHIQIRKNSYGIDISADMFDTIIFAFGLEEMNTYTHEIRFTVTDVTKKDGINVYTVTAGYYINGYKNSEKSDIKNTGNDSNSLRCYDNLAGKKKKKKLS